VKTPYNYFHGFKLANKVRKDQEISVNAASYKVDAKLLP
jgi:hypothetical protein